MISEIFSIYVLVEAVWLILPAYAANGLVPLLRGKHRADFGRNFIDGKPLLGSGKTLEGFIFGPTIAAVIATVMMLAYPYLPWYLAENPIHPAPMTPLLGIMLGIGAMCGDSVGSFLKRRMGMRRGQSAPLIDQLDFLFGAFLFASVLVSINPSWVIIMAIVTPGIHLLASFLGFSLKLKKEPW